MKKKLVPVGPLVEDPVEEDDHEEGIEIIQWLDKKERSSTVFVSFGSEYFLPKEEMEGIALGLEFSGVDFIWVVRFPSGVKVKVDEELPKHFLERTKERAMVVEGWAPQMKILGHWRFCESLWMELGDGEHEAWCSDYRDADAS